MPEGGPSPKSPAVVLEAPGETRTITVDDFPADGALTVDVGGHQVVLNHPEASHHIEVDAPDEVVVRRGIWQLVHSLGY